MGQILSWIRGTQETPTLQDVAVDEQSQHRQDTPKPAAQVSTTTPSQLEKASSGSAMASKSGGVTTAKGGSRSASTSIRTAGQGLPTAKPQTNTKPTVIDMSSAGSTVVNMTFSGTRGSPEMMSKTSPVSTRTSFTVATGTAATTAAANAALSTSKGSPQDRAKVHVEVRPKTETIGAKEAPLPADTRPKDVPKPLSTDEALESLSFGFMTSTVPTVPKMQEKKDKAAASSAAACYAAPSLAKKVDVPAPKVATQPPADKKAKMEVDNFSLESLIPPDQFEKTVCMGPPKLMQAEKASSDFSLKAGLDTKPNEGGSMSQSALGALSDMLPTSERKPEPTLRPEDIVSEKKHKEEDAVRVGERDDSIAPEYRFNEEELKKLPAPKPEPTLNTNEALDLLSGDLMTSSTVPTQKAEVPTFAPTVCVCPGAPEPPMASPLALDALSALSDTLPADAPRPEPPKLRPEDIVSEKKHKEEDAVLVGEREDSIAPEYRFNEEELKKRPAPKPEPSLNTNDALSFLSGDFTSSSAAPAQTKKTLTAQDLLTSTKSSGVHAPVPPTSRKAPQLSNCPPMLPPQGKPKTDEGDYMPLDALGALSDTLPASEPTPEPPKLRPEDIVSEAKHKEEEAVRVGEREDSIAPKYRFNEEELKNLPAPKPQPKMNTSEALDLLSCDLTASSAPAVQAPVLASSAAPVHSSADFALNALAEDFVPSSAAPKLKSAACAPTETASQFSAGDDGALDALSKTLITEITPAPQPAPVPAKDLVKEKKAVEERLIKMGERDDSLPPEYRPTEEDLKKMAEAKAIADAKPKMSMDDKTALDLLASDFNTSASSSVAAATELTPPVLDSKPLKSKNKSKSKFKKQHASEPPADNQLSGQLSSDVVVTSTKQGKKS
ncbi:calpastatin isoform X6 [Syngnathus scovelli]|uniref:calpastatin isoform X6 n=1 Tax=Syngnathus scovelli TaxID=161590 RepID=UPI0021108575|nr:calpastatin isoform X6 [Syngnathus scovelli]